MRVLTYFLLLGVVAIYAFARGGRDERIVSGICIAGSLASLAIMIPPDVDYRTLQPLIALIDLGVLSGFVWIALKSHRFWPLWVSGFQLTALTGHFLKVVQPDMLSVAYSAALAFWSYLILLILAGATWRSRRPPAPDPLPA